MTWRAACVALALWASAAVSGSALAQDDPTIVHIVRPGETLASIAELYYGEPRRESVIVAENGLGSEGGSSIVVGLRLVIPTVHYHRVQEGETWPQLAERFYGDVRRAFLLTESNPTSSAKLPDVGAEILVPYPLRYFGSAHDPVRQAAKDYYDGSAKTVLMIRRFNAMKPSRVGRGDILLLPLSDLVLSAKGKKVVADAGLLPKEHGDVRDKQLHIHEELPSLHEHVVRGRYVEAVAMANRLIGVGDLTGNQIVTIQRELGTALIALERDDLALEAFKTMLEKQPDAEFGIGTTSPKVLRVLEEAKKALAAAKVAAAAAKEQAGQAGGSAPPPSAAETKNAKSGSGKTTKSKR